MERRKIRALDGLDMAAPPARSRLGTYAANENVPGTITPDDGLFFLALALI